MSGKQLAGALLLVLLVALGVMYSDVLFWVAVVASVIACGVLAGVGLVSVNAKQHETEGRF